MPSTTDTQPPAPAEGGLPDHPLKVYDRRPVSKRWAIPERSQREVVLHNRTFKFCDHCRLPQPVARFRDDASKPGGLYGTCRSCEAGRQEYADAVTEGLIPPQPPAPWREDFPPVVALCGSTRFWETFRVANLLETLRGRIVLSIGAAVGPDEETFAALTPEARAEVKAALDELHLRKIDLADEVLVLDVGGYIDESTGREIEYAQSFEKPVRYWSKEAPGGSWLPPATTTPDQRP